MIQSKEIIIFKIICLLLLIYMLFNNGIDIGPSFVLFTLVLIINNNLRTFYIKKDAYISLSILLEIIIGVSCYILWGGNLILYIVGSIIDMYILHNKIIINIYFYLMLIVCLISSYYIDYDEIIINTMIFLLLNVLINYVKKLYDSRKISDELYDKLRISEEKLMEANKELEYYSQSIEELTLLKERNRISREIHDSVGHALTTTLIQLSAIESIAVKEKSKTKDMISLLREFVNESFQDVKKAVRELKPDEYENFQGVLRLQDVCKNFEKMSGVKIKVTIAKGEWYLSTRQVQNLYRVTQEILSNALRHGKATEVNVIMNFTDNDFVMSFKDNGVGTDKIIPSGVGLKSIRERITELNGVVDMNSKLNEGFFIKITIPKEREI